MDNRYVYFSLIMMLLIFLSLDKQYPLNRRRLFNWITRVAIALAAFLAVYSWLLEK
jgi:hypothetical protein